MRDAHVRFVFFLFTDISLEMFDTMGPILDTLTSQGLGEEKKSALCELQKLIREDSPGLWDDSFKRVYEAVMKAVEDEEVRGILYIWQIFHRY